MKKSFAFGIVVFVGVLFSCSQPTDSDNNFDYPAVFHYIEYLGRGNLPLDTSSSVTDAQADQALLQFIQEYSSSHSSPDSSMAAVIDGITYEIDEASLVIVTGGVPQKAIDRFYDDLEEYAAGLWSVWGYAYGELPSKGATFPAYILYAMRDDEVEKTSVRYIAIKGTAAPK